MPPIDWDSIRARHPLASVAQRTNLQVPPSGRAMVRCPLPDHDDSTPSMQLDLNRNRYRCYGCGAHGDVIQWTRDLYGVNAVDAIRILTGQEQAPIAPP